MRGPESFGQASSSSSSGAPDSLRVCGAVSCHLSLHADVDNFKLFHVPALAMERIFPNYIALAMASSQAATAGRWWKDPNLVAAIRGSRTWST